MPQANHFGKMKPANPAPCRACNSPSSWLWDALLLDLCVSYMRCDRCGYVQTEQPYWLDRAYANTINDSDTGIMERNLRNVRVSLAAFISTGSLHQRVVDFAGGYGILTRLLRDCGVDALWSDRFSSNLLARGFEHAGETAGLVTAFEAFEHFVDPGLELEKMLAIAPNILLSTEIIPEPVPLPGEWWYYGRDHGQHIGFFTVEALRLLAASRGKHLISDGRTYHLITSERVSARSWRLLLRFNKLLPIFVGRRLKSKTWEDHLKIAGESPNNSQA